MIKMLKTYKFRLSPTKNQIDKLDQMLETCRILYNSCLVDRNRHYESTGKGLSYIAQAKILTGDKKRIEYLTNIHSQVLQDVLKRVEKAYNNFFRRVKEKKGKAGYPRFKPQNRYDSITYTQSGFEIIAGKLKLSKIGHIKIKQHRQINGDIKTCAIKKEIDKWYVCFSVEYTPIPKPIPNKQIGIDVGIKSFAVLTGGKQIDNPKYLIKSEKRLIKKQRQLSSKVKGSNNRKKARIAVATLHKKVSNQRRDFHHKVSREIVDNYNLIKVEDLRIKNMVKNHKLAKSISDASWGQFFFFLTYKAVEAGSRVERVDPRYTSMECHVCHNINYDLTLADRTWTCPSCHTVHDRDGNSAVIIDNKKPIRLICSRMFIKAKPLYPTKWPEFTLGETGSMDDPSYLTIAALKSIPSLNQEAPPERKG